MCFRRSLLFAFCVVVILSCSPKEKEIVWRVISPNGLNVRADADPASRVVGQLRFNDEVRILRHADKEQTLHGKTGRWAEIRYESGKGWVFSPFLVDRTHTPALDDNARIRLARAVPATHEDRLAERWFKEKWHLGEGNHFNVTRITEKMFLAQDFQIAHRTNDVLYLKLKSGKWLMKKNRTGSPAKILGYYYQGHQKDTGLYTVVHGFYEGLSLGLFRDTDGMDVSTNMLAGFHLDEYPAFSPDKKSACLIGIDSYHAGASSARCIVVASISRIGLEKKKILAIDSDPIVPVVPVWIENDALRLIRGPHPGNNQFFEYVSTNRLYVFNGKDWQVRQLFP